VPSWKNESREQQVVIREGEKLIHAEDGVEGAAYNFRCLKGNRAKR